MYAFYSSPLYGDVNLIESISAAEYDGEREENSVYSVHGFLLSAETSAPGSNLVRVVGEEKEAGGRAPRLWLSCTRNSAASFRRKGKP